MLKNSSKKRRVRVTQETEKTGKLDLTDFEISMLIIERNTCQHKAAEIDELLNKIGAAKGFDDAERTNKKPAAVNEITFSCLKFEEQKGLRLGDYDVAYKQNNLADKWSSAYNILRSSSATIKTRYMDEGYQFSYWLYGEDKIYRQKLRVKNDESIR